MSHSNPVWLIGMPRTEIIVSDFSCANKAQLQINDEVVKLRSKEESRHFQSINP